MSPRKKGWAAALVGLATIATTAMAIFPPFPESKTPVNASPPVITGTAVVGQDLTEGHGAYTGHPYRYAFQWQQCDSAGASCSNIVGQTAITYTVAAGDVSHKLRVQETASNGKGAVTASSVVTALVPGAGGGPPVTGASLAVCSSPNPCTTGTLPTATVNVVCGQAGSGGCSSGGGFTVTSNLLVNNGSSTENRSYGYYIPNGLCHDGSSASCKPAALFDYSRCSSGPGCAVSDLANDQVVSVANANHFIVIILIQAPGQSNPYHPQTDCSGAGGVVGGGSCGASSAPSDAPYVLAAVNDATTRFHLDSARLYMAGQSATANTTREMECATVTTPHTSTLFRGISLQGGGAQALYGTTTGHCPSGDKSSFYLEFMGGNGNNSDPTNTLNIPTSCTSTCDHTILGFDGTRAWWSAYLGGCSAPVHTTINPNGNGVNSDVYDYSNCTNTINATTPLFEAVKVGNGGHTVCNLDQPNAKDNGATGQTCTTGSLNTGGFQTYSYMWNFFANTGST